jgi:hypothetical protein
MPRPLMQHGVGQLEEMFGQGKSDPKLLKQLENELRYRQVPRAVALLTEVQAAMNGAKSVGTLPPVAVPSPRAPQPHQPELWISPSTPPTPAVLPVAPAIVRTPASIQAAPSPSPPPAAQLRQRAAPTLTVDDACKVLKTTLGATWESIEQTRRLLVQQSSPLRTSTMRADRRAQAIADAKRANEAYAVLSAQRVGDK